MTNKPLIAFRQDLIDGVRAWEILSSMRTVDIHSCDCRFCESDGEAACAYCDNEVVEECEYGEHGETLKYKCSSCKKVQLSVTATARLEQRFHILNEEYNIPYPKRP